MNTASSAGAKPVTRLDVVGQPAEAVLHGGLDVRVVTGCVGLHLHPQLASAGVRDELHVGLADARSDRLGWVTVLDGVRGTSPGCP